MKAYKRSALYLHGLSKTDQGWLLNKLPSNQRNKLQDLLDDLSNLKIPGDSSLLTSLEATHSNNCSSSDYIESLDDAINILSAASPAMLNELLDDEPLELIAILLEYRDWSWRSTFLNIIGVHKQNSRGELQKLSEIMVSERVKSIVIQEAAKMLQDRNRENVVMTSA